MLDDLVKTLAERGIEPIGAEGAPRSVHTEHRIVPFVTEPAVGQGTVMPVEIVESAQASIPEAPPVRTSSARGDAPSVEARLHPSTGDGNLFGRAQLIVPSVNSRDANLPFTDYVEYAGLPEGDPRSVNAHRVAEGIVRIVEVEGPLVAKRAYDIYLRGCGIKRMGHELKSTMNKALANAIREQRLLCENEVAERSLLFSVVRMNGSPPIKLRTRGPRSFEEIPPSELQVVARYLLERHSFPSGSDEHLRAVLECFDLKRLTTQVGTTLLKVLERSFPYVDEFLSGIRK